MTHFRQTNDGESPLWRRVQRHTAVSTLFRSPGTGQEGVHVPFAQAIYAVPGHIVPQSPTSNAENLNANVQIPNANAEISISNAQNNFPKAQPNISLGQNHLPQSPIPSPQPTIPIPTGPACKPFTTAT